MWNCLSSELRRRPLSQLASRRKRLSGSALDFVSSPSERSASLAGCLERGDWPEAGGVGGTASICSAVNGAPRIVAVLPGADEAMSCAPVGGDCAMAPSPEQADDRHDQRDDPNLYSEALAR